MGNTSKSLIVGALASTLLAGSALAADYTPPPVIDFEPEYEVEFGGNFYLRGFVGFSNQEVDSLDNTLFATTNNLEFLNSEFESGGVFGGAVGYRLNQWFRADISAEYRMRTGYSGLDRWSTAAGPTAVRDRTNLYSANKSELLFLANAFVDLGTYYRLTPYIGAGVGASYTTISGFTDVNEFQPPAGAVAYAESNSEWSFAWALHAGLAYQVTDDFAVELGYRYLDLGDASTGDILEFTGANNVPNNPMHFNGLTSHDVHLGMRWEFGGFGGHDYLGY